eukprot:750787-Prymnesium_polylepis.1
MPLPWPPRANGCLYSGSGTISGGLTFQAHLYRPELLRPRHIGQVASALMMLRHRPPPHRHVLRAGWCARRRRAGAPF